MMEDWSEWNETDTYRMEKTRFGFLEIVISKLDIQFSIEDALIDIYLNYEDTNLITLEISDIILIFNKMDYPHTDTFQVVGRKYDPQSHLFLKTIQLGEISTEQWENFPSFYNQMYPLVESWIGILS